MLVTHMLATTNRTTPIPVVSDTGSPTGFSLSQEHTMATVDDHNQVDRDTSVELSIAQVLSDEFTIDLDDMKTIMRRFEEIKFRTKRIIAQWIKESIETIPDDGLHKTRKVSLSAIRWR